MTALQVPAEIITAAVSILKPYAPDITAEKIGFAIANDQEQDALHTIIESAAKMRVSPQTIARAIKSGDLPCVRVRRRVFVRESDIRNAIAGSGIHAA